MRRPDSYASLQPTHSTIVSIINPSYRCLPAASKHTALPRSHLPHQPNPHSGVRGILCAPSPAGSFLGGFRTPATGVCRAAVAGRHPKPSTQAVIPYGRGTYWNSTSIRKCAGQALNGDFPNTGHDSPQSQSTGPNSMPGNLVRPRVIPATLQRAPAIP